MATTTTPSDSREPAKQEGVLKKVIKYLQAQAVENSTSRSVLSPPGLEPQQRLRVAHSGSHHIQYRKPVKVDRRFSEATTVVEPHQRPRRPGAMAGERTDAGVFLEDVSPTAKEMRKVQYAQDNILQNYKLHIPPRDSTSLPTDPYWIIYIHGGYFRDPKVDASSFRSALEILTANDPTSQPTNSLATVPESATPSPSGSRRQSLSKDELVQKHVVGYASINYRLAPHPAYPQNDDTESYVRRNAEFPQQVQDVHAAIRHLQTRFDITNNYILAGHSVGATLAFLAALEAKKGQIDPPACVVGLNGIYDFPYIHHIHPDYEPMTRNAMRPDQFATASPALYTAADYASILPGHTLQVLLSHSRDDGLVDWSQLERMQQTLESGSDDSSVRVAVLETKGEHDAIWRDGRELARTLVDALAMVVDS